ncbi:MAG: metallophosphoesterase [Desulfurococcaceae archaeon]
MKLKTTLFAIVFLPLLLGLLQAPTTLPSPYISTLSYIDVAKPLPVTTIGPAAPVVVAPGSCFNVVLGEAFNVSTGYMWQVAENGKGLLVENYTVVVNKLEARSLEICVPPNVVEGLYDLELVGSTHHSIPRSIWVLEKVPRKIRVVIMSDLHFGAGPQTLLEGDICRFSAAFLASSLNSTFMIWAGDITDSASESETIQAQVYRYLFLYKYPVLSVPGNHDNPGNFYAKYLGPVRWVRVLGDRLLLVGIYTNPYREGGIGAWEEISFLEEALKNYSHIPLKIVVFHYPLFYYQGEVVARYDDEETLKPYEPGVETPVSSYWSSNMTSFRYVLKLIEDYNVTAVISGHVHRDQFVKYTSTRTNTTTYFITVTATGMGAATYQGIISFEIDTEAGDLSFPVTPPSFIGFKYSSSKLSLNSIPVKSLQTKLVKSSVFYKLEVKNTVPWLSVNSTLVVALPWNRDLTPRFKNYASSPNSSITVLNHITTGDMLYLSMKLYLGPGATDELMVMGLDDTLPPTILLKKYIPAIPTINRTLTIYMEIVECRMGCGC